MLKLKWKPTRKEGGVISHFYSPSKGRKERNLKRAVVFRLEGPVLPSCAQDVKGLFELLS